MKINIKQASVYLPYKVKALFTWNMQTDKLIEMEAGHLSSLYFYEKFILVLKPIEDLLKEEYNHLKQTIIINSSKSIFEEIVKGGYGVNHLPYYVVELLLEKHFDIFNLIKEGIAEDENTVNYGI